MRTFAILLLTAALACAAAKKEIRPQGTPPGRPFSPGILVDDTLYVAGHTGTDPKTGKIPEEFEAEVRQTMENIRLVLKAAGMDFDHAVTVTVYLTDIDLFQRMNAVYTTFFKPPLPARTTVQVAKLVGGARIEVTVTAHK